MSVEKLKPCPFCGSEPIVDDEGYIMCGKDGRKNECPIYLIVAFDDAQKWNRRHNELT